MNDFATPGLNIIIQNRPTKHDGSEQCSICVQLQKLSCGLLILEREIQTAVQGALQFKP